MKYISLILILTLIISACDEDRIISSKNDDFITVFKTTDTTGRQKTTFYTGEEFIISFSVKNNTGKTIIYSHGEQPLCFEIRQRDSLIATPFEGLAFIPIWISDTIEAGEIYKQVWHAPWTFERGLLSLPPGKYTACVEHRQLFGEYRIPQTRGIWFNIIP